MLRRCVASIARGVPSCQAKNNSTLPAGEPHVRRRVDELSPKSIQRALRARASVCVWERDGGQQPRRPLLVRWYGVQLCTVHRYLQAFKPATLSCRSGMLAAPPPVVPGAVESRHLLTPKPWSGVYLSTAPAAESAETARTTARAIHPWLTLRAWRPQACCSSGRIQQLSGSPHRYE